MKQFIVFVLATCASLAICPGAVVADVITDWNLIALRATEVAGFGPPPQTRIMAMMHAAIYDAVNAIDRRHAVHVIDVRAPAGASMPAAAIAAAGGVLVRAFPAQQPTLEAALGASLAQIPEGEAKARGMAVGREVAARLFEIRQRDGADAKVAYTIGSGPGVYQITPPMNAQPVVPHWGRVKPFILDSATQFSSPGPPDSTSPEFARDFNEVKTLGARNSPSRTTEQTATAIFWAGSEIPPLNALARAGAAAKGLGIVDNARLFAYLNMAMADSLIAGFEVKYRFNHWRPITAIRNAASARNAAITPDPNWEPMMVTPPHPEYPSAHTLATGAAAQVLTGFLNTDSVQLSLVQPPLGVHRRYQSIAQIVKEMEDARVWAGIHFRTSDVHGTRLGRQIGEHALRTALQPASATTSAK